MPVFDGSWREFDIRLVYDQVWGKTRVRDVRFPILTLLGFGHEEGNSKQLREEGQQQCWRILIS